MTKRRRGLIPMTPQDTAAAYAIGLTEVDLRDFNDLFLTMKAMPAVKQFGLIVRAFYRRGIRRQPLDAVRPAPRVRGGPSPEAMAKLDAVMENVNVGAVLAQRPK